LNSLLILPYTQFLPAIAKDVLQMGPAGLGLLMAANGVGGVVGSFIAATTSSFRRRGLVLLGGGLITGTGVLMLSLSHFVWLSLLWLMLAGIGGGLIMATGSAITQLIVPDEFRGRISSVQLVIWGLMPVGTLPLAAIANAAGVPVALTVSGALSVAFVVVAAAVLPSVRRLQC
jgi:MFS family permease